MSAIHCEAYHPIPGTPHAARCEDPAVVFAEAWMEGGGNPRSFLLHLCHRDMRVLTGGDRGPRARWLPHPRQARGRVLAWLTTRIRTRDVPPSFFGAAATSYLGKL